LSGMAASGRRVPGQYSPKFRGRVTKPWLRNLAICVAAPCARAPPRRQQILCTQSPVKDMSECRKSRKAPAKADECRRDWYKDAVIYQLHVRAFYDSNNDGVGDFQGLAQKLDYVKD